MGQKLGPPHSALAYAWSNSVFHQAEKKCSQGTKITTLWWVSDNKTSLGVCGFIHQNQQTGKERFSGASHNVPNLKQRKRNMEFLLGSDLTCHKFWSIFSEAETAALGYSKTKAYKKKKKIGRAN